MHAHTRACAHKHTIRSHEREHTRARQQYKYERTHTHHLRTRARTRERTVSLSFSERKLPMRACTLIMFDPPPRNTYKGHLDRNGSVDLTEVCVCMCV